MIFLEVRNWTRATPLFSLPHFWTLLKLTPCCCVAAVARKRRVERESLMAKGSGTNITRNAILLWVILLWWKESTTVKHNCTVSKFFVGEFRTDSPFFPPVCSAAKLPFLTLPSLPRSKRKKSVSDISFSPFLFPCGERARADSCAISVARSCLEKNTIL